MSTIATEVLYNGIKLDVEWPPRNQNVDTFSAFDAPYLENPPHIIPIDIGRQLFVDDFLIEETDCVRFFVKPKIHPSSPILIPETYEEMDRGNCPMAAPFNDGVWYDSSDQLFKMWYMAGWFHTTAIATSVDGIRWTRPQLDVVPGTNLVWKTQKSYERDGCLVWLDGNASNPEQKFKMFQFYRYNSDVFYDGDSEVSWLQTSKDGIHWSTPVSTTPVGDNTSFFYNPFRKKWCMSIRRAIESNNKLLPIGIRSRFYTESDDFMKGANWDVSSSEVLWHLADTHDLPDPAFPNHVVILYDVNAVAYESLMIGLFGIFRGPENNICKDLGIPKTIDLELGYSRDGFHFTRPDRTPFIGSSRVVGDWRRAYLHAAGGICLVVNDELYFYFTGFSGESPNLKNDETGSPGRMRNVMYAGASTGLATLRRDGFAFMKPKDEEGRLTTRLLSFSGTHLFINGNFSDGELQVEILDVNGRIIEGYSRYDCLPVSSDKTKVEIQWKERNSLVNVKKQPIHIRFYLRNGELYSFWISASETGASNGYVAAGGPGFTGGRDI